MIIYMKVCNTKGVLGSWKLWFSYIIEKKNQNQNFGSFSADFWFRAEGKKVISRAELKILQLEVWLQPARLELITSTYPKIIRPLWTLPYTGASEVLDGKALWNTMVIKSEALLIILFVGWKNINVSSLSSPILQSSLVYRMTIWQMFCTHACFKS